MIAVCDWVKVPGEKSKACVAVAAAPMPTPTPTPTPPPTPPQTSASAPPTSGFDWDRLVGCCRQDHRAVAVSSTDFITGVNANAAKEMCAGACANDTNCTAFEVAKKKTKRGKPLQHRCELHAATVDSAARATKACKAAQCFVKRAPSVSAPTAAPTAAPTPAPTAGLVVDPVDPVDDGITWIDYDGCCRENWKSVQPSKVETYLGMDLESADDACEETCSANDDCTAYEVISKKARQGKPIRFRCELHDGEIDSASQASKSCKRATCHVKGKATMD